MPDDGMIPIRPRAVRPAVGTAAQKSRAKGKHHVDRDGWELLEAARTKVCIGDVDITPLRDEISLVPLDTENRAKKLTAGWLYPGAREISFDPPLPDDQGGYFVYYQPPSLNPESGGIQRRYTPIGAHLARATALVELTFLAWDLAPHSLFDLQVPVRVNWHLVRLFSDGRRACTSSPPTLHCDGEPITAIVLLDRLNLTDDSGESVIAKRCCAGLHPDDVPEKDIFLRRTLTQPLDMLIVDDRRVSHFVSSVLGANEGDGYRSVLLIDYSGIDLRRTPEPRPCD